MHIVVIGMSLVALGIYCFLGMKLIMHKMMKYQKPKAIRERIITLNAPEPVKLAGVYPPLF
jgi:hypothetical protein